jgi:hypothetical protein
MLIVDEFDAERTIFTLNGTQNKKWLRKDIKLNQEDILFDFRIGIEAIMGKSDGLVWENGKFCCFRFVKKQFPFD